jgi:site-specific recombinase XerD
MGLATPTEVYTYLWRETASKSPTSGIVWGFCVNECMPIKLILRVMRKYKIYLEIEEFLANKQRFKGMNGYDVLLYDFVNFIQKTNVNAISLDDIQRYKTHLTNTMSSDGRVGECIMKLRYFFRFWHVRKMASIKPNDIK